MSDEIKERLIKYLDKLESGMSTAGEFVAEQAPDVVHQWLRWELCFALFWVVVLPIIWIFAFWISSRQVDLEFGDLEFKENKAKARFAKIEIALLLLIPTAIPFVINATTAAKIALAPKVLILQEVAKIAKSL